MLKKPIDPRNIEMINAMREIDKDTFEKLLAQKIRLSKQNLDKQMEKSMSIVKDYNPESDTESQEFKELTLYFEGINTYLNKFLNYLTMKNSLKNNGDDFKFLKEITPFSIDIYLLKKQDFDEVQKQKHDSQKIEKNREEILRTDII